MGKRTKKKSKYIPFYVEEVATGTKIMLSLNPDWCRLEPYPVIENVGIIDFTIRKDQGKLYDYLKGDPSLVRGLVFKALMVRTNTLENFVIVAHFTSAQVFADKIVYSHAQFSGVSNLWVIEFQNDYPKELFDAV